MGNKQLQSARVQNLIIRGITLHEWPALHSHRTSLWGPIISQVITVHRIGTGHQTFAPRPPSRTEGSSTEAYKSAATSLAGRIRRDQNSQASQDTGKREGQGMSERTERMESRRHSTWELLLKSSTSFLNSYLPDENRRYDPLCGSCALWSPYGKRRIKRTPLFQEVEYIHS